MIYKTNNRPSGSGAKTCDRGLPVSGRTAATGEYQILKVGNDGGIITGSPVADTGIAYAPNPMQFLNPIGGALPVDRIVFNQTIVNVTIAAGVYRINPFHIYEGTAGGSLNFLLVKELSTLNTYAATRNAYVDNFTPTVNDYNDGFSGIWHNVASEEISNNIFVAYNRNNPLELYLESGTYRLVVFVHTGISTVIGSTFTGFYQFTQIA